MLEKRVRSELKQEVKQEMQPFVLVPTYVYLVGIIGGLVVSIWREWSVAVSVVSILCMTADTFLTFKFKTEAVVSVEKANNDVVIVDTGPEMENL